MKMSRRTVDVRRIADNPRIRGTGPNTLVILIVAIIFIIAESGNCGNII